LSGVVELCGVVELSGVVELCGVVELSGVVELCGVMELSILFYSVLVTHTRLSMSSIILFSSLTLVSQCLQFPIGMFNVYPGKKVVCCLCAVQSIGHRSC